METTSTDGIILITMRVMMQVSSSVITLRFAFTLRIETKRKLHARVRPNARLPPFHPRDCNSHERRNVRRKYKSLAAQPTMKLSFLML